MVLPVYKVCYMVRSLSSRDVSLEYSLAVFVHAPLPRTDTPPQNHPGRFSCSRQELVSLGTTEDQHTLFQPLRNI